MEYMGGGTLHDYIRGHQGGLGEARAKKLFHDVVIGIRDIHALVKLYSVDNIVP